MRRGRSWDLLPPRAPEAGWNWVRGLRRKAPALGRVLPFLALGSSQAEGQDNQSAARQIRVPRSTAEAAPRLKRGETQEPALPAPIPG